MSNQARHRAFTARHRLAPEPHNYRRSAVVTGAAALLATGSLAAVQGGADAPPEDFPDVDTGQLVAADPKAVVPYSTVRVTSTAAPEAVPAPVRRPSPAGKTHLAGVRGPAAKAVSAPPRAVPKAVPAPPVRRPAAPPARPAAPVATKGAAIASAALAQLGAVQDCTRLATNALAAAGIRHHGWPVDYFRLGQALTPGAERPGDLIYYANGGGGVPHIAVYVGGGMAVHGGWNGNQTVHASAFVGSGPVFIRV